MPRFWVGEAVIMGVGNNFPADRFVPSTISLHRNDYGRRMQHARHINSVFSTRLFIYMESVSIYHCRHASSAIPLRSLCLSLSIISVEPPPMMKHTAMVSGLPGRSLLGSDALLGICFRLTNESSQPWARLFSRWRCELV